MEEECDKVLHKVLQQEEIDQIPLETRKKLEQFYEQRLSEFYTAKALQLNIGEYFSASLAGFSGSKVLWAGSGMCSCGICDGFTATQGELLGFFRGDFSWSLNITSKSEASVAFLQRPVFQLPELI